MLLLDTGASPHVVDAQGWFVLIAVCFDMSKLLTLCVLRPTQPPTLSGTGNE